MNIRGPQGPLGPHGYDPNSIPSGFFGLIDPRPFKGISELLGMLANILIQADKAQDPEVQIRFLQLYDTTHKGLSLFVDQEFYSKIKDEPKVLSFPGLPENITLDFAPFGEEIPDGPHKDGPDDPA